MQICIDTVLYYQTTEYEKSYDVAAGFGATENSNNSLDVIRGQEMVRAKPESGVDLAFDALMDLEENSDLSNFMKVFIEGSGDALDLWSSLDCGLFSTNKATMELLRYNTRHDCGDTFNVEI